MVKIMVWYGTTTGTLRSAGDLFVSVEGFARHSLVKIDQTGSRQNGRNVGNFRQFARQPALRQL